MSRQLESQKDHSTSPLYNRLTWLIALAFLVLLLIYWGAAYVQFQSTLDRHIQKNLKDVTNQFHTRIQTETRFLEGSLRLLQNNDKLQQAFINEDRETLIHLTQPIFQQVFLPNQVTHFYLTGPDRVNFLRVHAPDRFGDLIDRHTQKTSAQTQRISTGIEMGVFGTSTLRSVLPWYNEQKELIGYLELGIDLDNVIQQLSDTTEHPMFMALDKKHLDRQSWQQAQSIFEQKLPWTTFDQFVVSGNTGLTQKALMALPSPAQLLESQSPLSAPSLFLQQTSWQPVALKDVEQRPIGYLFVSLDLEQWQQSFWLKTFYSSLIFIFVSILVIIGVQHYRQRIHNAEEEVQTTLQELNYIASYDQLTDLPNRDLFFIELDQHIKEAQLFQQSLTVCFIDIDDFKKINDTMGHAFGDKLLKAISEYLLQHLREVDILSRFGGDEFVLLIPHSDMDYLSAIIPYLLLTNQPFDIDHHHIYISTSIGISHYPQDGEQGEALLRHADMAMYHAKHQGKSRYRFFEEEMNLALRHQNKIETALREAIKQNQLSLHYQAQFDLNTQEFLGFEALVRWITPDGAMISPGEFIPVAERSRLILELDDWVINEACRQYHVWAQAGYDISIGVNLSGRFLYERELKKDIVKKLEAYQVPYDRIGIEITENTLIEATDTQVKQLEVLAEKGIKLSLDDFGTGYSSLSYLKNFPVQVLKIDQAFVRDAPTDRNDYTLMEAIASMGHSLGLKVIAEGIETDAHEKVAKAVGCDRVQGFYYHKPQPANALDFNKLLKNDA